MASLERAVIINTVTGSRITVMFNPTQYTINQDNNFASMGIPGLSGPLIQFVHGNARTLELELFFDTYEENRQGSSQIVNQAGDDVRDQVMKVVGLMAIDPTTHAPPVVEFHWSSLNFTCVVTREPEVHDVLPTGALSGQPCR